MLVLMRHGETHMNAAGQMTSRTDVGLSEKGHHQAKQAALACQHIKFQHVVSSPLRRAQETAQYFSTQVGIDPMLREFDFGCFEGISGSDLLVSEHKLMYQSWLNGDHVEHGGESWRDLRHRCENIMQTYGPLPGQEPVLLVTHGYIIRSMMALVLESPVSATQSMRVDNTNCLILSHERGNVRVVGFNSPSRSIVTP